MPITTHRCHEQQGHSARRSRFLITSLPRLSDMASLDTTAKRCLLVHATDPGLSRALMCAAAKVRRAWEAAAFMSPRAWCAEDVQASTSARVGGLLCGQVGLAQAFQGVLGCAAQQVVNAAEAPGHTRMGGRHLGGQVPIGGKRSVLCHRLWPARPPAPAHSLCFIGSRRDRQPRSRQ
jgi:hypothetical protein